MNDAAVVGRILREYHLRGLRPSGVTWVHGTVSGGTVAYRVAPDDEPPFVVRAFRADAPVPAQFSGSAAETMVDWVTGRARTLGWLEGAGYPAPRVVRPRSGELVGVAGQWLTWATTFVDGPVLRPTLEQLRLLGGALGRLHSLDVLGVVGGAGAAGGPGDGGLGPDRPGAVPDGQGGVLGRAAWHPAAAVATTLARLQSVAAMIPLGWRDMHDAFLETAQTVQSDSRLVPEALVHGDAWPGNAVQAGAAEVTLIDWETAGLGLPVLDLGHCLAECHLDSDLPPDRPEAWLVQPDEHRIAAVASGYAAVRPVPAAERELLGAGVRFGAAFVGAIHFEAALTRGASGPSMDARLERLRNRVAVSDEVARLALRHLAPASAGSGAGGGSEAGGAGE